MMIRIYNRPTLFVVNAFAESAADTKKTYWNVSIHCQAMRKRRVGSSWAFWVTCFMWKVNEREICKNANSKSRLIKRINLTAVMVKLTFSHCTRSWLTPLRPCLRPLRSFKWQSNEQEINYRRAERGMHTHRRVDWRENWLSHKNLKTVCTRRRARSTGIKPTQLCSIQINQRVVVKWKWKCNSLQ